MKNNSISDSLSTDSLNLKRLILLRYITAGLMLLGTVVVTVVLDIALNRQVIMGIACLNIVFNILTEKRLGHHDTIAYRTFFIQLLYDVSAFTTVLYFTGGAMNPFAWYFLLYIILSATLLPPRYTWTMAVITMAAYSVLFNFFIALPGGEHHGHHDTGSVVTFSQHIFGMWFGFILSALLVVYFVVNIANTLRERDQKLAIAREQALRNERLVALGTLAAGAAHELGTPLGTMAIVAHELERNYADKGDTQLIKQLGILTSQVARCKEALSVMSASTGEARAESGGPQCPAEFMQQVIDQWKDQRPHTELVLDVSEIKSDTLIIAERTLEQALINILNNAADASPDFVGLASLTSEGFLDIQITDHGDGLNKEAAIQIGKSPFSSKDQGMGVGLYLAHATIERLGGSIDMVPNNPTGTCVQIRIPLLSG